MGEVGEGGESKKGYEVWSGELEGRLREGGGCEGKMWKKGGRGENGYGSSEERAEEKKKKLSRRR